MELSREKIKELIREAAWARQSAYAPYSGYGVGAALLTKKGQIFRGCNVENISYGLCNCAERTAVFKAVSEGEREFCAIAIVGGMLKETGNAFSDDAYPCGACRQVLKEFCGPEFVVIVAKNEEDFRQFTLEELLPMAF